VELSRLLFTVADLSRKAKVDQEQLQAEEAINDKEKKIEISRMSIAESTSKLKANVADLSCVRIGPRISANFNLRLWLKGWVGSMNVRQSSTP
jgi:hypothetical protein